MPNTTVFSYVRCAEEMSPHARALSVCVAFSLSRATRTTTSGQETHAEMGYWDYRVFIGMVYYDIIL